MQVPPQPQTAAMHLPTTVQQRALQQHQQHRRDRDDPLAQMQYLKASTWRSRRRAALCLPVPSLPCALSHMGDGLLQAIASLLFYQEPFSTYFCPGGHPTLSIVEQQCGATSRAHLYDSSFAGAGELRRHTSVCNRQLLTGSALKSLFICKLHRSCLE